MLAFLCSFAIVGCDDDVNYPNSKLIKGQWQLVEDGDTDNPLIYRFTTDSDNTWSWGGLMTYHLSADGTVTYDKRYTWHVSDPANEEDGKWHTYFMGDEIGIDLAYGQINHIPAARTARAAEEVAEIRRYINRLDGNHIADADFYLAEMREGIKQAEAARRKKNADTEGENAAERTNVGQNYSDTRVVKDEYHHRYKVTRHWLNGRVEAIEVWDLDHTSEPPQSLEAPPTAKHPTPPPILGRRRRKRARRGAQAAPGLRSAPGMCAGGCGVSRHVGRRAASVTSLRGSVGISGMVHGGSFRRGALPRAGPPYTENQVLPLQNNFD